MENKYDSIKTLTGYSNIFKTEKTLNDLIAIIRKYRCSAWLDVIAKIEAIIFLRNDQSEVFFNYLFQKEMLELLQVNSSDISSEIFSLPQLNLLRKLAIVYGLKDPDTDDHIQRIDIAFALLIATDINSKYDDLSSSEKDINTYWNMVVRNGYSHKSEDGTDMLTRARCMYLDYGTGVPFRTFDSFGNFLNSTISLPLGQLLVLGYSLSLHHFEKDWFYRTSIIDRTDYYKNIIIDDGLVNSLFSSTVLDLAEVKKEIQKEIATNPLGIGYDFGLFTKHPLIDLGNNKIVTTSIVKLYEKFTQNLCWFPLKLMALGTKDRDNFIKDMGSYRGILFEKYIRMHLSEHIANNTKISQVYIDADHAKDHEELCDSILVQEESIAVIEMKSKQPKELFRTTGSWSTASDFLEEIKKAATQIEIASNKILSGMYADTIPAATVKIIYPIIVLFDPLPTHGKLIRFIRDKLREENILTASIFAPLEILIVSDIETVSSILNKITIIDLLEIKKENDIHSSESSFGNFFANYAIENVLLHNGRARERRQETFNFLNNNLTFK